MTADAAVDLVRDALTVMLILSAPILVAGLLIGLVISLLQAVTQIQEQTLSFVPKIVGMAIVAIIAAPWMFHTMIEFAARMFTGK